MNIIEKLGITPGPWDCSREDDLFGKETECREITAGQGFYGSEKNGFDIIAYMSDANTRLIASAPEMLEALIGIGLALEDYSGGLGFYNETIQDVIKKATGLELEKIKELLK